MFFHGNAGNLTFPLVRAERLRRLHSLGLNVLAVDYRGYGKSPGKPDEGGLYQDGESAYKRALKLAGSSDQLLVHGRSLGGGVACYIASRHPCRAVILESTFTSIPDVVARILGGWSRAYLSQSFPNLERVLQISAPLLVIHGTRDALVPYQMGEALYQRATSEKRLFTVEGATHNNLLQTAGATYLEAVKSFLDGVGI